MLDSVATDNWGSGILLHGRDATVVRSKANKNGGDGIQVSEGDSAGARIVKVVANKNHDDGIDTTDAENPLDEADLAIVVRSTATKNGDSGVALDCPGNLLLVETSGNNTNLPLNSPGDCALLKTSAPSAP